MLEEGRVRVPEVAMLPEPAKTWKAEPVAVPPMVRSKLELMGERTLVLFNCQKSLLEVESK